MNGDGNSTSAGPNAVNGASANENSGAIGGEGVGAGPNMGNGATVPQAAMPQTAMPQNAGAIPNMGQQQSGAPLPPYQVPNQPSGEKFYKKTWFIVLALIFLAPVGIVLMWVFKKPENKTARIVLSVIFGLLILGSLSSMGSHSDTTSTTAGSQASSGTASQVQASASAQQVTLESITAKYSGATKAGTMIDGKSGFTVTGTYSNGKTKTLTDFTIDNPAQLVAFDASAPTPQTFTVSAEGKQCTVDILCTTVDEESYKAVCESVDYETIARNPDSWKGKNIKVTGEVIQVQESSSANAYRVSITEGDYGLWTNPVYVVTASDFGSSTRVLEDDIVTVYGISYGLYTYTTVLGAQQTVPAITAEFIDIN